MDEYMVEINDLRRRIGKLKFARASVTIIEELEAQLRILKAIYDSASSLYAAGEQDRRLQAGFSEQAFGDWTFDNVYFYVYEQAVALEPDGHDLATLIWHHDYAAPLLGTVQVK
jgi:DNA mismatch repair ATPase MutS